MKKTYGRKVFIAIVITGLIELLGWYFYGRGMESQMTVLFCIIMAVGGSVLTLSELPEEDGDEKMGVKNILTALMLLVAETYAAGMLLL